MQKAPFAVKWTIKEDDLKELMQSDDQNNAYKRLESKYITTEYGIKYYLQIYPNGNREANNGKVFIFFGMEIGNLRKVEAKYTVRIECANDYSQKREDIFEESTAWGEYFCESDALFNAEKRFIVDGKLTLKFDGIFDFGIESSCSPCWTGRLGDELWADEGSKDFVFLIGEEEIKAHKAVLAAASPIFDEMFKTKSKESIEGQLECSGISRSALEIALKVIYDYNGNINYFCREDEMAIFEFYDKYNIQYLKDRFEDFLMDKVSAATVCKTMNCAIKANATKLHEKCMKFLMEAFKEKTPLADVDVLDKEVALKILQNCLYHDVETD